jgi:hypothetical protein
MLIMRRYLLHPKICLAKPTKGWPVGKYKVEIYVGDELATTTTFTIKAGKSAEDSEDESSDE